MLTDEQRRRIEERLVEERERALEAIGEFDETFSTSLQERSGELSVYRFHMADLGTEALEQEKQHLLASKEGERLYRIDDALRRLYREPETFGQCANCGREIGFERLEIMPEGALCIDCQTQAEA